MKHHIIICLLVVVSLITISCSSSKKVSYEVNYESLTGLHKDFKHKKQLPTFLAELKAAIEAHDWPSFFRKCSKQHYRNQVISLRINAPTYVANTLGINEKGNDITPPRARKVEYDDINRIKTINYTKVDTSEQFITVKGNTILNNDSSLNILLNITIIDSSFYALAGKRAEMKKRGR